MLGCGILRREVMRNFGRPDDGNKFLIFYIIYKFVIIFISKIEIAWASGCGLERLALLLFDITDIRLFWS